MISQASLNWKLMCFILVFACMSIDLFPTTRALHVSKPDQVNLSNPMPQFGLSRKMLQRTPENSAIAGQSSYYQSSSLSDKRLRALFHSPMLPKSNTHASLWTVPNFFQMSRHRAIINPNLVRTNYKLSIIRSCTI